MATIPDSGPMWWDRDVDDRGTPIRADVRQAAHKLWPEAVRRVQRTLSDPPEAAELLEITVVKISRHLDRTQQPPFSTSTPALLQLHFSQELRRLAMRLGRIELVGEIATLEELAVVEGWTDQIDRRLYFKQMWVLLTPQTRTLLIMRFELHPWDLIGAKLGVPAVALRKAFWRDLREVISRLEKRGSSGDKGPKNSRKRGRRK